MNTSDPDAPNDGRVDPILGAPLQDHEVVSHPRSFGGSSQSRWAMIIGGIALVVVVSVWGYANLRSSPKSDRVSLDETRARGTGAVVEPTPRQRDLVVEENRLAADEARLDPRGVEVPPFAAANSEPAPPPAPVVAPPVYPVRMARQAPPPQVGSSVDYVAKLAAAASTIRDLTRLPLGHATAFANAPMQAPAAAEAAELPPGGLFAVGEYLTARLEMGVNSDYAGEVTAVIMSPYAYRGIRLVGDFDQPNSKFSRNRVAIRFKHAYPDPYAQPVNINAVAVEPGARVPALKGKVNYHVIENVVFHLGGAFVQGYASGLATSNLGAFNTVGGGEDTAVLVASPLNPALTGAAGAAQALTSPRGIRPPTVQMPAGTAIGVIVLAQQRAPVQPQLQQQYLQVAAGQSFTDPIILDTPLPTTMRTP